MTSFITHPISLPSPQTQSPQHGHFICAKRANPPKRRPPPPPTPSPQIRLLPTIRRANPKKKDTPAQTVSKTLKSRHDLLLIGPGLPSKLSAIFASRERSEHALVLLPTRMDVERAAAEIDLDRRGAKLIVCAGSGGSSWAFPDLNANSSLKPVIVVGTPRAVAAKFCASAHGRPWLNGVRFLVFVDPDRMVEVGCLKEIRRIYKPMRERLYRKNVVVAMRKSVGEAEKLVADTLRNKFDVVEWAVQVENFEKQEKNGRAQRKEIVKAEGETNGKVKKRPVVHTVTKGENPAAAKDDDKCASNITLKSSAEALVVNANGEAKGETKNATQNGAAVEVPLLVKNEVLADERILSRRQCMVISSHRGVCGELLRELREQMSFEGQRKVVGFFPTARLAECYACLARAAGLEVFDLNRKSNSAKRTRILERFYKEEKGIVFASDMLTKDWILPEVDCVVQVGLPQTKEQYLRRVGMVGEGGIERFGLIILANVESEVAIRELALGERIELLGNREMDDWKLKKKGEIWEGTGKRRAYESWLGYYRHCRKRVGWTRPELVGHGNEWAKQVLGEVPMLEKKVIDRLFLRNVVGIVNVE